MADMDKFIEINQNFDTVKTLLNSIRAQGILNTSDVDKLLSGINAKLEKINTEEDIDLIKIFLSELKKVKNAIASTSSEPTPTNVFSVFTPYHSATAAVKSPIHGSEYRRNLSESNSAIAFCTAGVGG